MLNQEKIFVEFDDDHLKVLRVSQERARVIYKNYAVLNIKNLSVEQIQSELKSVVRSSLGKRTQWIFLTSRSRVILKTLHLPSRDAQEIARMMPMQIAGQTPYALEDIVFDDQILRIDSEGYSEVLAAIVPIEGLEESLKYLETLGVKCQDVILSSCGYAMWFAKFAKISPLSVDQTYVVIDRDCHHSEIIFFKNSQFLFSRRVFLECEDMDNRQTFQALIDHMEESCNLFVKDHRGEKPIRCFIVSSEEINFPKSELEKHLKIPCEFLNPFELLDEHEDKIAQNIFIDDEFSWMKIFGCASMASKDVMHLSPPSVLSRNVQKRHRRLSLWSAGCVGVMVAILFGFFVRENVSRNIYVKQLQADVKNIQSQAQTALKISEQTRTFDQMMSRRTIIADVMKEFFQRAPSDVVYQSIVLSDEGDWILQGYAENSSSVHRLQTDLMDALKFDNVQLDYATERKLGNTDVTDFKIHCRLAFHNKDER